MFIIPLAHKWEQENRKALPLLKVREAGRMNPCFIYCL